MNKNQSDRIYFLNFGNALQIFLIFFSSNLNKENSSIKIISTLKQHVTTIIKLHLILRKCQEEAFSTPSAFTSASALRSLIILSFKIQNLSSMPLIFFKSILRLEVMTSILLKLNRFVGDTKISVKQESQKIAYVSFELWQNSILSRILKELKLSDHFQKRISGLNLHKYILEEKKMNWREAALKWH